MIPSAKAAEKLKEELLSRVSHAGLGFRVYNYPDDTGAPRLALKLDVKKPQDEIIDCHGVYLYLDQSQFSQLKTLELDYEESPTGGFVLK